MNSLFLVSTPGSYPSTPLADSVYSTSFQRLHLARRAEAVSESPSFWKYRKTNLGTLGSQYQLCDCTYPVNREKEVNCIGFFCCNIVSSCTCFESVRSRGWRTNNSNGTLNSIRTCPSYAFCRGKENKEYGCKDSCLHWGSGKFANSQFVNCLCIVYRGTIVDILYMLLWTASRKTRDPIIFVDDFDELHKVIAFLGRFILLFLLEVLSFESFYSVNS